MAVESHHKRPAPAASQPEKAVCPQSRCAAAAGAGRHKLSVSFRYLSAILPHMRAGNAACLATLVLAPQQDKQQPAASKVAAARRMRWVCPPFVEFQAAFRVDFEGVPIKEVFQGVCPSCAAGILGRAVLAQATCQVLRHVRRRNMCCHFGGLTSSALGNHPS